MEWFFIATVIVLIILRLVGDHNAK
jgi:hypothetical protein